jgi:uncharacterized protein YkuJ
MIPLFDNDGEYLCDIDYFKKNRFDKLRKIKSKKTPIPRLCYAIDDDYYDYYCMFLKDKKAFIRIN